MCVSILGVFRRRKWIVRLSYLWAELEQGRRHHSLLCGSSAKCPAIAGRARIMKSPWRSHVAVDARIGYQSRTCGWEVAASERRVPSAGIAVRPPTKRFVAIEYTCSLPCWRTFPVCLVRYERSYVLGQAAVDRRNNEITVPPASNRLTLPSHKLSARSAAWDNARRHP